MAMAVLHRSENFRSCTEQDKIKMRGRRSFQHDVVLPLVLAPMPGFEDLE